MNLIRPQSPAFYLRQKSDLSYIYFIGHPQLELLFAESIFGSEGVIGCRSQPTLIGISETTDAI